MLTPLLIQINAHHAARLAPLRRCLRSRNAVVDVQGKDRDIVAVAVEYPAPDCGGVVLPRSRRLRLRADGHGETVLRPRPDQCGVLLTACSGSGRRRTGKISYRGDGWWSERGADVAGGNRAKVGIPAMFKRLSVHNQ